MRTDLKAPIARKGSAHLIVGVQSISCDGIFDEGELVDEFCYVGRPRLMVLLDSFKALFGMVVVVEINGSGSLPIDSH